MCHQIYIFRRIKIQGHSRIEGVISAHVFAVADITTTITAQSQA